MKTKYDVLILGASYGSLLGFKLLMAGHNVAVVCRPHNAQAINRYGVRIRLPIPGKREPLEIDSRELPGNLVAGGPEEFNPSDYDLVALAMQEPQYRSDGVRELLDEVGRARIPCVSIMNMPPPPYLKRIPGLDTDALESCYSDASVWRNFDPSYVTLCSPDPQAFRLSEQEVNILQVTLPTNFKAARFESEEHTAMLRRMQAHISVVRYHEVMELPVKLKVFDSIFVPLAKWPMLMTGNYRCVQSDAARSIRNAVHADLEASRAIYEWVSELCISLGATLEDLVPFEKYAHAATHLDSPSSAARALFAGATAIERVDRLVQAVAAQRGMQSASLDETVRLVDARLELNREADARPLISA
ncbi:MAG: hypothetical protein JO349_04120 [Candidatus Eremiobacteraeota bacterium]|nr:hypothetical protein [Candidatus Eremiobacteraeota bacterium]